MAGRDGQGRLCRSCRPVASVVLGRICKLVYGRVVGSELGITLYQSPHLRPNSDQTGRCTTQFRSLQIRLGGSPNVMGQVRPRLGRTAYARPREHGRTAVRLYNPANGDGRTASSSMRARTSGRGEGLPPRKRMASPINL